MLIGQIKVCHPLAIFPVVEGYGYQWFGGVVGLAAPSRSMEVVVVDVCQALEHLLAERQVFQELVRPSCKALNALSADQSKHAIASMIQWVKCPLPSLCTMSSYNLCFFLSTFLISRVTIFAEEGFVRAKMTQQTYQCRPSHSSFPSQQIHSDQVTFP